MKKDLSVTNPDNYPWIRKTGQTWKLWLAVVPAMWGFWGILVCIPLGFLVGHFPWARPAITVILVGYLILYVVVELLEAYGVRCPKCGYNVARGPDRRKRSRTKTFCDLQACPRCGYDGST